ncbi:MAG: hypothetical protein HYU36_21975 [Planctomycetes bacterium]|nr:hypothetical protein [Planctomycetota bacterium]
MNPRAMLFLAALCFLSAASARAEEAAAAGDPQPIRIRIDRPARVSALRWPVTFGVPFPRSLFQDVSTIRILDERGRSVPAQFVRTGVWPDGSVRWALADFTADLDKPYFLSLRPEMGASASQPQKPPPVLRMEHDDAGLSIHTGPAQYVFRNGSGCFEELRLDLDGDGKLESGGALVRAAGQAFTLVDSTGRQGILEASRLGVEFEGPLHSAVRIEGEYRTAEGQRQAAAVVDFHFYAGHALARVSHKLIVTEDTNRLWFRDIAFTLPLSLQANASATFSCDPDQPAAPFRAEITPGSEVAMVQDDFPHFGSTASHFSIAEVREGERKELQAGVACGEWADLSSGDRGLALQVPGFAEQFPKAFRASSSSLAVKLWASESGRELDYRTPEIIRSYFGHDWIPEKDPCNLIPNVAQGTSKTHDLWIFPHAGPLTPEVASPFAATREEIYAAVDPDWIARSGVLGPIHPKDTARFPEAEEAVSDHFDRTVLAGNKVFPAAGYLYWGMYPYAAQSWELRNGRWYPTLHRLARCLEYNLKRSVWILYARSGERKYFDYARRYTRLLSNLLFSSWDVPSKPRGWTVQGVFHSPIVWGQFTPGMERPVRDGEGACLAFASSEDIIQFVYDYFITGDLHSRDMARNWTEAMVREMNFDVDKAVQFFPPSAFFRILGSACELDPDPRLLDYGHRIMERLVLADGRHVLNPEIPQNYGKEGEVFSGFYYFWVATGDPLARKALVELARFRYRQAHLDGFFSRASCLLQAFALAWEDTGEKVYADYLAQAVQDFGHNWVSLKDMGVDLDQLNPNTGIPWGHLILTSQSTIHIGIPVAESAIVRSGVSHPNLPVAVKKHPTQRTVLLLERSKAAAECIDVFVNNWGDRAIEPHLLDSQGHAQPLTAVKKSFHRSTRPDCCNANSIWYCSYEDQIFFQLEIPETVPLGVYHLDLGNEVAFTVLHADAARMMQVAPDGTVLEPNHRYHFTVPNGVGEAVFFAHRPVRVFDPQGRETALESLGSGRYRFSTGVAASGPWSLETANDPLYHEPHARSAVESFVRMETFPLAFALDDPERLFAIPAGFPPRTIGFLSQHGAAPAAKGPPGQPFQASRAGLQQAIRLAAQFVEWPMPKELAGDAPRPEVSGEDPAGDVEGGTVADAAPLRFPRERGTVEYWYQPLWSATDCTLAPEAKSTHRLQFFRLDPISLSYSVDPDNGGRTGRYNLAFLHLDVHGAGWSRARIYLEAGTWYHVALTWNIDGRANECDLFINGRKKAFYHYDVGMLPKGSPGKLLPPGPQIRFGSGRTSGSLSAPGDLFDELRISHTVRYREDFDPPAGPFQPDAETFFLAHLDGDLTAALNGKAVSGKAVNNGRLW